MSKRTTMYALEEAKLALDKMQGDDEAYHSLFDDLLEERLTELDPKFMESMKELYDKSGVGRWCA